MWLIVGGDSQIGRAVYAHLRSNEEAVQATTRRVDPAPDGGSLLDLRRLDDWAIPAKVDGACICAANGNPASCAADPTGSWQVNVRHTIALTERLVAAGAHVVWISTNQVFDGAQPHVAADAPTCPVSEYGRQKAATEQVLRAMIVAGAPVAILRLAKVATPGMGLIAGWVNALRAGSEIQPFDDLRLAPVPVADVARAIRWLLGNRATGVFPLSGPRDVTYAELARSIAERVGADPELVIPGSASDSSLPPGSAPRHTTMDSSEICACAGLRVGDPWSVMEPIVGELVALA